MYRLTILFLQIVILLIVLSFIFSNPFIISLDIGNLKYTFSSNILSGIALIVLFLIYLSAYIFFKSKFSINKYVMKTKYRRIEKGYHHFVDAMIAVANKDNKNASISHKKMVNYLKNDKSLSLLLRSEVFKIEKKHSDLLNVYEQMIKSKKTEALGYRGLMEMNLNNQDYHHAFLYGEKLFSLNPQIDKLYETLVYIAAKTKNWNQLIIISDKAFSKKIISKKILNENKSIGFYEIAKIKSNSNIKEATQNILKAVDLKKNFSPYIKLHLELIHKTNNIKYLKKTIKKYWSQNPSANLRIIITTLLKEIKLDNLNIVNDIINNNYNNEESKKLLIAFAIHNQQWKIARNSIEGLVGSNPSQEICLFMADIELGEESNKQKSDAWILRSQNAHLPHVWTCKITSQTQLEWSPISNSGYFNSLVWSAPKMLNQLIN